MIPVLVHHELNQKNQTGGASGQQYVRTCIVQAKRYNEKVVLFGDESNRDWCDEWYDVSDFKYQRWEDFLRVFENYSDYPDAWAKGIFKRFFVFEDYLKRNGLTECVILDSDVLTYINFSNWDELKGIDAAIEIALNQRIERLPYDNGLKWRACVGIGYMKLSVLSEFIDFCIETYANNKQLLMEKWEVHQEYSLSGGLCEMSLLYLWQKQTDLIVKNIGLRTGDILPVVVVNGRGGDDRGIYEYALEKRIIDHSCVRIKFIEDIPYLRDINTQKDVKVYGLHFGGKTKIFMKGIAEKKRYTYVALAEWYYWELRGKFSKLKQRLF